MAGIAIGGMIFLLHLVGVPLTGASMNPARTFGPALISGHWEFHWIYWVGPIIGAVIAGLIMQYLYVKKDAKEAKKDEKATAQAALYDTSSARECLRVCGLSPANFLLMCPDGLPCISSKNHDSCSISYFRMSLAMS